MSEGIFYRCQGRARAADAYRTEYEAWKAAHVEAMIVRDLEGWISDVLAGHEATMDLYREVCQVAEEFGFDNPAEIGGAVLRVFDSTINLLTMVADEIGAAGLQKYDVEGAAELREALGELQRQREGFARIWPQDGVLWKRAAADVEAGKVRTLSEARDELRRRRSRRDS